MNELISEFFTFFLNFLFWYVVFTVAINIVHTWLNTESTKKEMVREHLDRLIRSVKIEQHNETTYWFDAENHQFLAQGKTEDEIISVLQQRFPKNVFILDNHILLAGPDFKPVPVNQIQYDKLFQKIL
jgi:hypothetical protein